MRSKPFLSLGKGYLASVVASFVVVAIAGLANPVHAQSPGADGQGEITVTSPSYTVHRTQGPQRQYRLLLPERVTVSRSVSYADLVLSRPADAAELRRRIEETAKAVCEALDRQVPRSPFDVPLDRDCVRITTEQAMVSARKVMARLG